MTFAEMQRGVFDDLQYQAQPKPGVQDRVRRYLNEALERVLRRPRLKSLRIAQLPFTSEAGRGFYSAAKAIERIDYIIDLTNGRRLRMRTRDWYRHLDPSLLTSGTPAVWIPEGVTPVEQQPQADPAGYVTLSAVSDSAADTTQRLIVRIIRPGAGGDVVNIKNVEHNLLHGLTPIVVFQSQAPAQIISISLDAYCFGNIILTDGGGRHLGVITHEYSSHRQLGFRLYPTPSEVIHYEMEGQYAVPKMTIDTDTPPFPDNFHEMLQCYARGRFYRKDGRLQQSREELAEFERYCVDLTAYIEYPVNYKPVAGKLSAEGARWSDVGPNYPADRLGLISD